MNKMLIICLLPEQILQLTGTLEQQLEINCALHAVTERYDMSDHLIYLYPAFSQLQHETHSTAAHNPLTLKYTRPCNSSLKT